MTRAQDGGQQGTGDKAAAGWFAAIMTVAFGGAGLIIAALAVGVERTWSGGAGEQQQAKERRGSWLDNQRSWLEQDGRAREARSRAYGSWLKGGANPDTRPADPSWWRRLLDAGHRRVANTAVAGKDFSTGFRDGWQAADQVRRDGGGFNDIRKARPGTEVVDRWACPGCGLRMEAPRDDTNGDLEIWCRTCRADDHMWRRPADNPTDTGTTPAEPGPGAGQSTRRYLYDLGPDNCVTCGNPGEVVEQADGRTFVHKATGGWCPAIEDRAEYEARQAPVTNEPVRPLIEQPEGESVSYQEDVIAEKAAVQAEKAAEQAERDRTAQANAQYAGVPYQGPAGATESNATVLRAKLQETQGTLHTIADLTDQLAAERNRLDQQVRDADEFAQSTGQSQQARTALDESNAISSAMGAKLGEFSQGAVSAEESMRQASDGLRVAENAEDELRSAGADGRAVAPAGANA